VDAYVAVGCLSDTGLTKWGIGENVVNFTVGNLLVIVSASGLLDHVQSAGSWHIANFRSNQTFVTLV